VGQHDRLVPAVTPPAPDRISWREWAGFMAMVVGMFMAILDIQIVSASLSEIQAGLSASQDEVSWVQTSYLVAEIVMIPLSGWLSRLLSTRILFVGSAIGFTVFSLLCSYATSLGEMIFYRAMQGFIGGAMIPTVFATAFLLFPPRLRSRVSVMIGLTATLAPTIGPTLGGWLTESLSWHWLFLINVPFGIAVAIAVWNWMHLDKPNLALRRGFDWWGLGLMALFLGNLEYILEEGARWDWFEDETIRWSTLVCALACVAFFWRMLTKPDPLVELRGFRNANFALGCLFSFVLGIGLYGSVYMIPLFLSQVRGYNSLQIGETMFVTGFGMFLAAPVVGNLMKRVDMRRIIGVGLALTGIAIWWTGHLTKDSAFWELLGPQVLRGFSMMFVMIPSNQIALGRLPPSALKNAAGLYNLMRNLGGAVGLAVINTVITDRIAVHGVALRSEVTWSRPGVTNTLDGLTARMAQVNPDAAPLMALKRLAGLVRQQALTLTYNDVLMAMAVAFFVAMPLSFLLAKPAPVAPDAGGGH
jgi:MFS transporter, DHA2 family, multidrug resistance protein